METELNRHGYPVDRTGLDAWSLYMRREHERAEKAAAGKPRLRPQEVTKPATEVPLSTLNRQTTVGKIAHMANDAEWDTHLYVTEYRKADHMRDGEIVEGKVEKHYWVNAQSPDRKHYLSVSKIRMILDGWSVDSVDEVKIHIAELSKED